MRLFGVLGVTAAVSLLAGVAAAPGANAAASFCRISDPAAHGVYKNLQSAVDQAGKGATLLVAGTCTGPAAIATISQNLTITASIPLRGSAVLNGKGQGTVLTIDAGATVTLAGLTITDGTASALGHFSGPVGGGIYNAGTLTLESTDVTASTAFLGGGIYNNVDAILTLEGRSAVSGNSALYQGGIYNDGTLTIGGQSRVTGNTAQVDNGGIGNDSGGTLTIGGRATVSGNTATSGYGGGILNLRGQVTLEGAASVTGNTAGAGGGIVNYGGGGMLTLAGHATVSFNTATGGPGSGGGIYNTGNMTGAQAGVGGNVFGNKPDNIDSDGVG